MRILLTGHEGYPGSAVVSWRGLITAEVPGVRPQWTLAMGIEDLVETHRRYDLRLDDLMGARHQRLKQINHLLEACEIDSRLRWTSR